MSTATGDIVANLTEPHDTPADQVNARFPSLLTVGSNDLDAGSWQWGVSWTRQCGRVELRQVCPPGRPDPTADPGPASNPAQLDPNPTAEFYDSPATNGDELRFRPFGIGDIYGDNCLLLPDDREALASADVERATAAACAYQLATGTGTANPSLQSEASLIRPASDAAVSVVTGISYLLQFLGYDPGDSGGVGGHGGGVLYVPTVAAPFASRFSQLANVGGNLRLVTGHAVCAGPGLPGTGPDSYVTAGGTRDERNNGVFWLYASDRTPHYQTGPTQTAQATWARVNNIVARAQRRCVVAWQPCRVAAVKVFIGDGGPNV